MWTDFVSIDVLKQHQKVTWERPIPYKHLSIAFWIYIYIFSCVHICNWILLIIPFLSPCSLQAVERPRTYCLWPKRDCEHIVSRTVNTADYCCTILFCRVSHVFWRSSSLFSVLAKWVRRSSIYLESISSPFQTPNRPAQTPHPSLSVIVYVNFAIKEEGRIKIWKSKLSCSFFKLIWLSHYLIPSNSKTTNDRQT